MAYGKDIDEATVEAGGIRTRYLTAGSSIHGGTPVVLFHGDGESAFDWTAVMPELARGRRVYAPDFPGHGDSEKPPVSYTPEFLARFATDFLDALDLREVALVGTSAGGLISLLLALDQPERVTSISLLSSAGLGRFVSPALTAQALPGIGEMLALWTKTPVGARQLAWTRALLFFARPSRTPRSWLNEQARLVQLPGFVEAAISSIRADLTRGMQRVVVLDDLPRLTMPVQVLWGENDRILPIQQGREAARRLPRGSFGVIPNAGHVAHVEQPDEFLAALVPFLDRAALAYER